MTLLELNDRISSLQSQINQLNDQMKEICDNRDIRTTVMPEQYYILLRDRQSIETKLSPLLNERSRLKCEEWKHSRSAQNESFVNSYGEATGREITCATYQSSLKRIERAVLRNMGI